MNGIAFGYPWKYRPRTDELVVMTFDQVFKLRTYQAVGNPQTAQEARALVEQRILEDVRQIRKEERRYVGLANHRF